MATPKSTSIVLDIKGRQWTFILMSDAKFDKLHTPEDGAMTVPDKYEVHFRRSHWNSSFIIHELSHVLFNMSLVGSSELTPAQVEETMCDINGMHHGEIGLWRDRIAEKFQQK